MQIQEQMNVPERPREIENHHLLAGISSQLHAQIDGYRRCAHAALRTHYDDELVQRWYLRRAEIARDPRKHIRECLDADGLRHEILNATAHGVQQKLVTGR